jgi:NAD(P)H-dependent FMN reductase
MPRLLVIVASTRPGRAGRSVADWFVGQAEQHGGFEVEVADLAELNLPLLDEPQHPMLRQYEHEHTKQWSAIVDRAEAVALVMPEYNYSFNAPLKNALDYLHHEWAYKPVAFVSYGGISGGTRAVQALKQVVTTLKMFPLTVQVALTNFREHLKEDGFHPGVDADGAAKLVLDELARVTPAFATIRAA